MNFKIGTILTTLIAVTATAAMAAGVITISQKDKQFSEKKIELAVGDTIKFVNEDPFAHNLYSKKGAVQFDTGVLKPGETYELKLDKNGKFTARCAIHPKMKLKVTVK